MSQSITKNTANQATINTDLSKIFVGNNRYSDFPYSNTNSTYDDITIPKGTLMGRIGSTLKVIPLVSTAVDGSQNPVGILAEDVVVEAGEVYTKDVTLCVSGDVAESKVILSGSETLDTLISSRPLRDLIGANTVGIKLVSSTENTSFDN
jgi:hypothetical protein